MDGKKQRIYLHTYMCVGVGVCVAMKIPKYEDKDIATVHETFQAIKEEAAAISASSAQRVEAIKKELEELEKEKERLKTVTVDEELANNPKLAQQIDEENEKNSFLVSP